MPKFEHPSRWLAPAITLLVVLLLVVLPSMAEAALDEPFAGAVGHFEAGADDLARAAFERVVADQPDHGAAHLYLGRLALRNEDPEAARRHLRRAVELEDSSVAHLWLGRALLDELQAASGFARATLAPRVLRHLELAVERDPKHLEARSQLGHYYLHAPMLGGGSKQKARQQAEAMVELDRGVGLGFLARVLAASADLDGAVRVYRDALAETPEDPELHEALGMLYQKAERWDEAIAAFEATLAIDADHRNAVYQIGRSGALSGRHLEKAASMMERFLREMAIEGQSSHAAGYWRLGMIRRHQGDLDAARQSFTTALELDPDLKGAREALRELGPPSRSE